MEHTEKALAYFDNNFNCAQAVMAAFADELGMSEDAALKVSTAFGGGIGRQQFTCGAVSGAAMVLGLKFGKAKQDEDEKKQLTYSKTVELFDNFTHTNGSTVCRQLLDNLNMRDEAEHAQIVEKGFFQSRCRKYIADAVNITENLINNPK